MAPGRLVGLVRIFRGYRARGARAPHIWVQIRVIIPKYAHISLFIPYIRVLYGLEDPAKCARAHMRTKPTSLQEEAH